MNKSNIIILLLVIIIVLLIGVITITVMQSDNQQVNNTINITDRVLDIL